MTITEYTPAQEALWTNQYVSYFLEDLGCDLPESALRTEVCPFILGQWEKGLIQIALAFSQETPFGFSIYHIDDPASDWCNFPGWGFIREFYIAPSYRKNGRGTALAAYTESTLRVMGAPRIYLTADAAVRFWKKCGYRPTSGLGRNGLEILVK